MEPPTRSMRAIGTTATVAVTDPTALDAGAQLLMEDLDAIDLACSRFRPDSELSRLHDAGGAPVQVSPLLFEAIDVACAVACATGGAVDPTVGAAVTALGYDRDFAQLARHDAGDRTPTPAPRPAPGWWRIRTDRATRTVRLPPGVQLDLGSSAKALAADRAAARIARTTAAGVLVCIGGDVAVAGPPPEDGWAVGIALDSAHATDAVDQVVAVRRGALASSSTAVRTWWHDGRRRHHIVDPTTGECAEPYWTLVTVSADSCVHANALTTAAVVWGRRAGRKLAAFRQPARLVRHDGAVVTMNGWPAHASQGAELAGARP
jgi:FAD:protein FMN transferase